ncbi:vitronectin a [Lampris incognitus]|uniref:vitronectin a n=1 Tax=Lampris incognitus TaxID=2546036 RepID=UPI0024B48709|nr:vitronectin a [Lampris incognitus]
MRPGPTLLLALLAVALAEDESCMGRCENGFDSQKECQCDSMCKYYKSCCYDYEIICDMKTRGDTFGLAEDDDDLFSNTPSPTGSPVGAESNPVSRIHPIPPRRPSSNPATQVMPTSQRVPTTPKAPVTHPNPITQAAPLPTTAPTAKATTESVIPTTSAPDPDGEICSGRPFNSFMQLKNGSIYAFRGEYVFELGQKSVMPGYPKLIKDVWGISGPIDAAFTRVNCQGKTYIFKGNKYWRFDDGVLDDDYPRDINVGFDKIPDHVSAAFALPAPSHHGKEKVYFFKGDQYYVYEFLHQPSHKECITMSERSPSTLFRRYTNMYNINYEQFFHNLFSDMPNHHSGHHFINRDWKGIRSPVDAVLAGRIYVSALTPMQPLNYRPDQQRGQQQGQQWDQQYQQYGQQWDQQYGQQWDQQYGQQWDQQYGQQRGRRRQNRSPSWESIAERGMSMGRSFAERGMDMGLRLAEKRMEMEEGLGRGWDRQDWDQDRRRNGYRRYNDDNYDSRNNQRRDDRTYWEFIHRSQPLQSIYFFKGDKYYRVDLRTKSVDPAIPSYPRSIAKYWLGCSDTTGAEKK